MNRKRERESVDARLHTLDALAEAVRSEISKKQGKRRTKTSFYRVRGLIRILEAETIEVRKMVDLVKRRRLKFSNVKK